MVARENTGVGRYTGLKSEASISTPENSLCIGAHSRFKMDGLKHDLMAVAWLANGRLSQIELVTTGDDQWDGVERRWRFWSELEK